MSNPAAVERYRQSNTESYLLTKARRRAKLRDIEFSLEKTDIKIPKKCPVLGIPLRRGGRFNPNSPTIDRIHNDRGYVRGNVVVISHRANMLKKDATIDELMKLARFYGGLKCR